jgi:uncharacterized protein
MDNWVPYDPVLTPFPAALEDTYGSRIDRVVQFGSRARRCAPGFGLRRRGFAHIAAGSLGRTGSACGPAGAVHGPQRRFFDALPDVATAYRDETPLMHEIRREGLDL